MGLFDAFKKKNTIEFDMDGIKSAGYVVTTAFVAVNCADYPQFAIRTGRSYAAGEAAGKVK